VLKALIVASACAAATLAHAQTAPPTAAPAAAGRPAQPMSADPALEARVLKIAEELRCLVCQNETIAASHAELAVDLRKQIRLKLQAGQSERQILDFMVERYGDFVLYRPPLKASTVMLWAGPFALLLTAAGVLVLNIRNRRQSLANPALSPEQAQRARELLEESAHKP
jgi:cytochrome c-type biogenesis protein CcmH